MIALQKKRKVITLQFTLTFSDSGGDGGGDRGRSASSSVLNLYRDLNSLRKFLEFISALLLWKHRSQTEITKLQLLSDTAL